MLRPVSTDPLSPSDSLAPEKPLHPCKRTNFHSSITTLNPRALYSWFPALLNQIYWLIKSSFFCFRYPSHHHTEFIPEINPKCLGTKDPFYRAVFLLDGKLKNQSTYALVGEIFDILGEGGVFHWGKHRKEIEKKKEIIQKSGIHPLESLYLIFHNEEMSKLSCHFLNNASFGIDKRFFKEHALEFTNYKGPISPHVSGFCKLLKLDETHVHKLAASKKWQDLIQYVYLTRKKHFNL